MSEVEKLLLYKMDSKSISDSDIDDVVVRSTDKELYSFNECVLNRKIGEAFDSLKILLNNNIALWNTIKSCKREGSLDSDIQNEKRNDIRKLLKTYPNIETICLNGNKSYSAFKKSFPDLLEKYNCHKMPSTSPANARYSLDKLVEE